ncbi:unnamed protein product [Moneuplotes crassus]|uniref:Uncharacterized protein n=1 Tax=Euplotes crassus TaxID=5936 RepID=A0AAD1UBD9_EUPCR|nr:unnamed protein product [Moneuplotes crassus]
MAHLASSFDSTSIGRNKYKWAGHKKTNIRENLSFFDGNSFSKRRVSNAPTEQRKIVHKTSINNLARGRRGSFILRKRSLPPLKNPRDFKKNSGVNRTLTIVESPEFGKRGNSGRNKKIYRTSTKKKPVISLQQRKSSLRAPDNPINLSTINKEGRNKFFVEKIKSYQKLQENIKKNQLVTRFKQKFGISVKRYIANILSYEDLEVLLKRKAFIYSNSQHGLSQWEKWAICIQKNWRGYIIRRYYGSVKRRNFSAKIIQRHWHNYIMQKQRVIYESITEKGV